MGYSQTSTNDHLSTTATVLVESPYIDSCFNTSLQWPPLYSSHFLLSPRWPLGEVQLYLVQSVTGLCPCGSQSPLVPHFCF